MKVKRVAREVLEKLKEEELVLGWRKKQHARASVRLCIDEILDKLPKVYSIDVYLRKCEQVYQHVYESYFGMVRSVYAEAI